jgi:predicted Zn-dependent protease
MDHAPLLARARAADAVGDDRQALEAVAQAIARRPDDIAALLLGVDTARRAGFPEVALPWLERLVGLRPDDALLRALLAQARDAAASTRRVPG